MNAISVDYRTPLKVPQGKLLIPLPERRQDHGYAQDMTGAQACRFLEEELSQFGAESAVIYSNFAAIKQQVNVIRGKADQAISVEFKWNGTKYMLVADRWSTVEANVYALHLTLRQLRTIERYGVLHMGDMLQSHATSSTNVNEHKKKLDEQDMLLPEWMRYLGLGPTATVEDANSIYRYRAKQLTNDEEGLLHLNQAIQHARRELKS